MVMAIAIQRRLPLYLSNKKPEPLRNDSGLLFVLVAPTKSKVDSSIRRIHHPSAAAPLGTPVPRTVL